MSGQTEPGAGVTSLATLDARLLSTRGQHRLATAVWLAIGAASTLVGLTLVLSGSIAAGIAPLAIGLTTTAVCAVVHWRSGRLEPPHELEARIEELRRLEAQLRASGVSQVEQSYEHLLGSAEIASLADDHEGALSALVRDRHEHVWEGIRSGRYVRLTTEGRVSDLDAAAIFAEVRAIVQEVAALYHATADNALLAARIGDIALAVRAVAGELLEVMRQVPVVDLSSWSTEELLRRLEQAEQARNLYRRYAAYDRYVTGAFVGARLVIGANPVALAAWYLGKEGAKKVGSRIVRDRVETWLKELLESLVAMIYLQAARTYCPDRAYRTAEWAVLTEALRIHALAPGIDHNRKLLSQRVLAARLPDEFAKLELLRALAHDRAVDDRIAGATHYEHVDAATRQLIATGVADIVRRLHGVAGLAVAEAVTELESRLGWGLGLDLTRLRTPLAVMVGDGLAELARLSRHWLDLDRAATERVLLGTELAAALRREQPAQLAEVVAEAVGAAWSANPDASPDDASGDAMVEAPRTLVGHDLGARFVDIVVDLLSATRGPWRVEHDHIVAYLTTALLIDDKRRAAAWKRHLDAAVARLREVTVLAGFEFPAPAAPAVLRHLSELEASALVALGARRWQDSDSFVVVLERDVLIGMAPPDAMAFDVVEIRSVDRARVAFERATNRLFDDLVLTFEGRRYTIACERSGSFERRFGSLLDLLEVVPTRTEAAG